MTKDYVQQNVLIIACRANVNYKIPAMNVKLAGDLKVVIARNVNLVNVVTIVHMIIQNVKAVQAILSYKMLSLMTKEIPYKNVS